MASTILTTYVTTVGLTTHLRPKSCSHFEQGSSQYLEELCWNLNDKTQENVFSPIVMTLKP